MGAYRPSSRRVLLLSQNTSVGRRILGDVVPKDRENAANGIDITDFGTFAEWNKAPSEYIAAHAAGLEIYTVDPMLQQC